ncbi:hypothetical protein B0I35DRAFT_205414 [Stachybotrys elegans]|uniref:Uncharacterized protein n=1 Tax=Stachybotrys elegans TaxID=80388 RepID=A0A8K0SU88_9HYPO|nr:hypothetical protein B0I35DRAFT_205414 [Stachybotrys elegans]
MHRLVIFNTTLLSPVGTRSASAATANPGTSVPSNLSLLATQQRNTACSSIPGGKPGNQGDGKAQRGADLRPASCGPALLPAPQSTTFSYYPGFSFRFASCMVWEMRVTRTRRLCCQNAPTSGELWFGDRLKNHLRDQQTMRNAPPWSIIYAD